MDVVEEQRVCKLLVHLVILGRKAEEKGGLKDRFVVGDEQQIPRLLRASPTILLTLKQCGQKPQPKLHHSRQNVTFLPV